jgi:hypothetical protein
LKAEKISFFNISETVGPRAKLILNQAVEDSAWALVPKL